MQWSLWLMEIWSTVGLPCRTDDNLIVYMDLFSSPSWLTCDKLYTVGVTSTLSVYVQKYAETTNAGEFLQTLEQPLVVSKLEDNRQFTFSKSTCTMYNILRRPEGRSEITELYESWHCAVLKVSLTRLTWCEISPTGTKLQYKFNCFRELHWPYRHRWCMHCRWFQIKLELLFSKSLILETVTQDLQMYVQWENSDSECLVGACNSSSRDVGCLIRFRTLVTWKIRKQY